ncbi:MAG: hypothetical protein PF440_07765 [Thiomicrorhabdus sp.]|jgi:predicted transposase YdaD|nr:hypothetical protein [Thiomicrorhabdus sp.]
MPFKSEKMKLPEHLDRRVKITKLNKQEIVILYATGEYSQRKLAAMYGVSRRTIQFTLFPDKLEENRQRGLERGGWRQYYDKDSHAATVKEHRRYKQNVLIGG